MKHLWVLSISFFAVTLVFPEFSSSQMEDEAKKVDYETVQSDGVLELEKEVHFLTLGGENVKVLAGTYHVEATESWLKLLPEGRARSDMVLLEADHGTHDEQLTEAMVFAEPNESNPDVFHLGMLLPNGRKVETVGSFSGVRARGAKRIFRKRLRLKSQNRRASQTRKLIQGDPAFEREVIKLQKQMQRNPQVGLGKFAAPSVKSQKRDQALEQEVIQFWELLRQRKGELK